MTLDSVGDGSGKHWMDMAIWVPQEAKSEVESKVQNVYQGIAFGIYSSGRVEIKAGGAGYKLGGSAGPL